MNTQRERLMLILLSVCLLVQPDACREERLSFSFSEASAIACRVRAQEKIAEWQQSHPSYRVRRWQCVARAQAPKDI
jgi:hypothetical protein